VAACGRPTDTPEPAPAAGAAGERAPEPTEGVDPSDVAAEGKDHPTAAEPRRIRPSGIPSKSILVRGGRIALYPVANTLELRLGSDDLELDLDEHPLEFQATSFTGLDDGRLIAGGRDWRTGEAEFVEVRFEASAGTVLKDLLLVSMIDVDGNGTIDHVQ
jgi:hypothetical protein